MSNKFNKTSKVAASKQVVDKAISLESVDHDYITALAHEVKGADATTINLCFDKLIEHLG